ncbi:acyl carrier protein [Luteolibacter marinus]|uniref:acyl carrier protein n=1 Tax=Luteolibacter marinus TaxID=2776705 RepID=UPI0018670967|nr:acyl carrier protein [Luteolibacter marinus]
MSDAEFHRGIESRVLTVVEEVLSLDAGTARRDSSIQDDLGADSLDMLSLFTALQEEFGGSVDLDEAEGMSTLEDVIAYISTRVKTAADAG